MPAASQCIFLSYLLSLLRFSCRSLTLRLKRERRSKKGRSRFCILQSLARSQAGDTHSVILSAQPALLFLPPSEHRCPTGRYCITNNASGGAETGRKERSFLRRAGGRTASGDRASERASEDKRVKVFPENVCPAALAANSYSKTMANYL